jgi:hypothetical protein
MEYHLDKQGLLDRLAAWDSFMRRKISLIACGGTALTVLGIKNSTKDVDLLVPDLGDYEYLMRILKQLGFKPVTGSGWARDDGFIFDLFRGKTVHTTELLESPLNKENNILVKEFAHIYLGALNYNDLIISKLFRSTSIDIDDCISLIKNKREEIDLDKLKERFKKTASFDISEDSVNKKLKYFLKILKKEGLGNGR